MFIEGTHDNLDLLEQYPQEEWNGGQVHRISGSLLHLMRGQVFTIEGKKIFTFGGGESAEMDLRAEDGTWWAQELPTEEEITDARAALLAQDNAVDCIVTHECNTIVRKFIGLEGERSNLMTHFFDEVVDKVQFRQWFFGCYHLDKAIPPRYQALFQKVIPLG